MALESLAQLWDRLPQPWRRRILFSLNHRFMIGVVGVVTDERGRVLILKHRFRTPWRWGLPGGFMSRQESMPDALRRELKEEVGLELEVDPHPIDWRMEPKAGYLSVTLAARVRSAPETLDIRSPEITGGGFYGRHELPEGLHPIHKALVLAYLSD